MQSPRADELDNDALYYEHQLSEEAWYQICRAAYSAFGELTNLILRREPRAAEIITLIEILTAMRSRSRRDILTLLQNIHDLCQAMFDYFINIWSGPEFENFRDRVDVPMAPSEENLGLGPLIGVENENTRNNGEPHELGWLALPNFDIVGADEELAHERAVNDENVPPELGAAPDGVIIQLPEARGGEVLNDLENGRQQAPGLRRRRRRREQENPVRQGRGRRRGERRSQAAPPPLPLPPPRCVVCFAEERTHVFPECMHYCVCGECAALCFAAGRCPLCNREMTAAPRRVYEP